MSYFDDNEDRIIYGKKRPQPRRVAPLCPECGHQAQQVSGRNLYPTVPHVRHRIFYQCVPCDTRVGTDPRTGMPLGTMAGPALRRARQSAHRVFDPLWQSGKETREQAYAWLARQMGLSINECHIALFDEEQCAQAVSLCVADDFEDIT